MEAVVVAVHNGKVSILYPVTNDQRLELITAIKQLQFFEESFVMPASICWYNVVAYQEFYTWVYDLGKESFSAVQTNFSYIKVQAARNLMNLLTSITSFDYLIRSSLSSIEKSELVPQYDQLTHDVFDSSLSYRFLYKLCNFTKHFALPISEVNIKDNFNVERRDYQFDLLLSRERLMAYDSWGPVKKDLQQLPEKIEIGRFVEDVFPAVEQIQKATLGLVWTRLLPFYEPVLNVYRKVRDQCNFPALAWPQVVDGKVNGKMDSIPIPTSFIEMLEKL